MHQRRIPEWVRHSPVPGVRGFAILAGIEAIARGILISVFPLSVYKAVEDAQIVSEIYFAVGLLSLATGLMIPWMTRFVARRWLYSAGALLFMTGSLLAMTGSPAAVIAGLLCNTIATVTIFICFNAYVLDFIARSELSRCETSRMFYSAMGWTIGPVAGVTLMGLWGPAPFVIAALAAFSLLVAFLYMRLGNGKLIVRARGPVASPLAYLPRFLAQPRLLAGWTFAVIRSCGWWVYVVYLPIFIVENGMGEQLGGIVLSISNGALFLTPLMLRWMHKRTLRQSVRVGFGLAGLMFLSAGLVAGLPALTIGTLMAGTLFLVLLDVCGGLPFLMAVKPSERTEMSAIYSSFRDVSGIVTPGVAWLVLLAMPLSAVFATAGAGLLGAWFLARTLHPRLGQRHAAAALAAPAESPEPAAFAPDPAGPGTSAAAT